MVDEQKENNIEEIKKTPRKYNEITEMRADLLKMREALLDIREQGNNRDTTLEKFIKEILANVANTKRAHSETDNIKPKLRKRLYGFLIFLIGITLIFGMDYWRYECAKKITDKISAFKEEPKSKIVSETTDTRLTKVTSEKVNSSSNKIISPSKESSSLPEKSGITSEDTYASLVKTIIAADVEKIKIKELEVSATPNELKTLNDCFCARFFFLENTPGFMLRRLFLVLLVIVIAIGFITMVPYEEIPGLVIKAVEKISGGDKLGGGAAAVLPLLLAGGAALVIPLTVATAVFIHVPFPNSAVIDGKGEGAIAAHIETLGRENGKLAAQLHALELEKVETVNLIGRLEAERSQLQKEKEILDKKLKVVTQAIPERAVGSIEKTLKKIEDFLAPPVAK